MKREFIGPQHKKASYTVSVRGGVGEPLWYAMSECGEYAAFFRAPDRAAAKAKLPGRTFYR